VAYIPAKPKARSVDVRVVPDEKVNQKNQGGIAALVD